MGRRLPPAVPARPDPGADPAPRPGPCSNRHLEPEVEIIFLAASQDYLYVSSSRLKELIRFGASVADFVPPAVEERLKQKLAGDL